MAHRKADLNRASGGGCDEQPNEVDREIVGALTDFRDTLRARTPLEGSKYTVRHIVVVIPPPQLKPEDVRKTREALGVSQPVFAALLGTSASTIRSWEQGQKVPSPMARRLLGLITADPLYWRSRLCSMVEARPGEPGALGVTIPSSHTPGDLPHRIAETRRSGAAKKGLKKRAAPKLKN